MNQSNNTKFPNSKIKSLLCLKKQTIAIIRDRKSHENINKPSNHKSSQINKTCIHSINQKLDQKMTYYTSENQLKPCANSSIYEQIKAQSFIKKYHIIDKPQLIMRISQIVQKKSKEHLSQSLNTQNIEKHQKQNMVLKSPQSKFTYQISKRKQIINKLQQLENDMKNIQINQNFSLTQIIEYKQHLFNKYFNIFITYIEQQCNQKALSLRTTWQLMIDLMQKVFGLLLSKIKSEQSKNISQHKEIHQTYQTHLQKIMTENEILKKQNKQKDQFLDNLIYNLRYRRRQIKKLYSGIKIANQKINQYKQVYTQLENEHIELQMYTKDITKQTAQFLLQRKKQLIRQKKRKYKINISKKKNRMKIKKILYHEDAQQGKKLKDILMKNYNIYKSQKGLKFIMTDQIDQYIQRLPDSDDEDPFIIKDTQYGYTDQSTSMLFILPQYKDIGIGQIASKLQTFQNKSIQVNQFMLGQIAKSNNGCQTIRNLKFLSRVIQQKIVGNNSIIGKKQKIVQQYGLKLTDIKKKDRKDRQSPIINKIIKSKQNNIKNQKLKEIQKQKQNKKIKKQQTESQKLNQQQIKQYDKNTISLNQLSESNLIKSNKLRRKNKFNQNRTSSTTGITTQNMINHSQKLSRNTSKISFILDQPKVINQLSKLNQQITKLREITQQNQLNEKKYLKFKMENGWEGNEQLQICKFESELDLGMKIDKKQNKNIVNKNQVENSVLNNIIIKNKQYQQWIINNCFQDQRKIQIQKNQLISRSQQKQQILNSAIIKSNENLKIIETNFIKLIRPQKTKRDQIQITLKKQIRQLKQQNLNKLQRVNLAKQQKVNILFQSVYQNTQFLNLNTTNIDKLHYQSLIRTLSDIYNLGYGRILKKENIPNISEIIYDSFTIGYGNIKNSHVDQKIVTFLSLLYHYKEVNSTFEIFSLLSGLDQDNIYKDIICSRDFILYLKLYFELNCSVLQSNLIENAFTTIDKLKNNCQKILEQFIGHKLSNHIFSNILTLIQQNKNIFKSNFKSTKKRISQMEVKVDLDQTLIIIIKQILQYRLNFQSYYIIYLKIFQQSNQTMINVEIFQFLLRIMNLSKLNYLNILKKFTDDCDSIMTEMKSMSIDKFSYFCMKNNFIHLPEIYKQNKNSLLKNQNYIQIKNFFNSKQDWNQLKRYIQQNLKKMDRWYFMQHKILQFIDNFLDMRSPKNMYQTIQYLYEGIIVQIIQGISQKFLIQILDYDLQDLFTTSIKLCKNR